MEELLLQIKEKYKKLRRRLFLFPIHMFFYSLFVVAFSPFILLFYKFAPSGIKHIYYERLALRWKYLFEIFKYAHSTKKYKYLKDYSGEVDEVCVDMKNRLDTMESTEHFLVLYEKMYFHIIPKEYVLWVYVFHHTLSVNGYFGQQSHTDSYQLILKLRDGRTFKHLLLVEQNGLNRLNLAKLQENEELIGLLGTLPNAIFGYSKENKKRYRLMRKTDKHASLDDIK